MSVRLFCQLFLCINVCLILACALECLCACLKFFFCLSFYLIVCPPVSLYIFINFCLCFYLFVHCMLVHLSVHLYANFCVRFFFIFYQFVCLPFVSSSEQPELGMHTRTDGKFIFIHTLDVRVRTQAHLPENEYGS